MKQEREMRAGEVINLDGEPVLLMPWKELRRLLDDRIEGAERAGRLSEIYEQRIEELGRERDEYRSLYERALEMQQGVLKQLMVAIDKVTRLKAKYEPSEGPPALDSDHWRVHARLLDFSDYVLSGDITVPGITGKKLQRKLRDLRLHDLVTKNGENGKKWRAVR